MSGTRGEYRPFFGSILDDPDFQAMPGQRFKVLFALKIVLGPAGIGVPRLSALAETVGSSLDELSQDLALLERKKPGEDYGWILRERNIIWLVNGLRHELLKPNNHPHKKRIQSQIQALGDKPIVRLFRSYYHEWFDGNPTIDGAKREPKGGHEGVSGHKTESESETKRDENSETETETRFLSTFYASATPARRAEVKAQLAASLSPEGVAVRKGEAVHARSRAHLDQCLQETLTHRVRDPDKAIVIALRKLTNPELDNRGKTVTEAASDRYLRDGKLFDLYHAEKTEAGRDWAKREPDRWKDLEAEVDRKLGIPTDMPMYETMRKTQLADAAGRAAGFPDYDTWLAAREVHAA